VFWHATLCQLVRTYRRFEGTVLQDVCNDLPVNSYSKPTRRTCYLKWFILVKRSTCFGGLSAPDDEQKDRPKHVEGFTRINNLR
jgi:hypothetical protein